MKEFIERLVLWVSGAPFLPVWAALNPAGVDGDCVLALLTADRAAPGKLAGAALHHLRPARSVSRPAAHQLAAVGRQARGSWVLFFLGENRETFYELCFQNRKLSRVSDVCAGLTVASSTGCSRDAVLWIQMAEIWGGCKVEQVSGSGWFDLWVPG